MRRQISNTFFHYLLESSEIIEVSVTSVLLCLAYQAEDFVTGYGVCDKLLIEPTDHCQTQRHTKQLLKSMGWLQHSDLPAFYQGKK